MPSIPYAGPLPERTIINNQSSAMVQIGVYYPRDGTGDIFPVMPSDVVSVPACSSQLNFGLFVFPVYLAATLTEHGDAVQIVISDQL